jgi:hypothetical protein
MIAEIPAIPPLDSGHRQPQRLPAALVRHLPDSMAHFGDRAGVEHRYQIARGGGGEEGVEIAPPGRQVRPALPAGAGRVEDEEGVEALAADVALGLRGAEAGAHEGAGGETVVDGGQRVPGVEELRQVELGAAQAPRSRLAGHVQGALVINAEEATPDMGEGAHHRFRPSGGQ